MASFDNYTDLQTTILNWMGRPGDDLLPVTDFISLFETDASRRLRSRYQEYEANIFLNPGQQSHWLPANFLEAREFRLTGINTNPNMNNRAYMFGMYNGGWPITPMPRKRVLRFVTPMELDELFPYDSTGVPVCYTLRGQSVRFGPIPDQHYQIHLDYWAAIPSLAGQSSGTNWLLTSWPDAYLWGALVEAETFLGADSSDDRLTNFMQRRELVFQNIEKMERKYRTGGAPLVMRRG